MWLRIWPRGDTIGPATRRWRRATRRSSRPWTWSPSPTSAAGRRRKPSTSPTAAPSTRSISRSDMVAAAPSFHPAFRPARWREPSAMPGFRLAFGFTLLYVSLIILLPLAALIARPWEHGLHGFVAAVFAPRTLAALKLSFSAAALAALANVALGLVIAWALTRYEFPFRRTVDALVDLPFALPTAVAGMALATLYGPNGAIGAALAHLGLKIAYTPAAVFV